MEAGLMIHGQRKILESKILIPDIQKDYERRDALLSRLREETGKLLVLHATIGYGKTVLMSQYARLPGIIPAWYHLDSLDNEFATFVQYLVMSFSKALGGFAFDKVSCYETESGSADRFARDLIMGLEDCLEGMEGQKLVLMLDDFQMVDNPEIFRLLEELLDRTGDRFLLIAAVKGSLPDSFTKYFMRNQGTIIGSEWLNFQEAEVHGVLSRMLSEQEAEQYAEMIWKNMEGWPAGVMFAALYLRRLGRRALDVKWEHISQESWVQNYITYELYQGQPYDIQQFLLRTSFVEELRPDLCNDICGINNARGILKYLLQENMFILRMGGKSDSYRYHSMFRSFLNDRASEAQKRDVCGKIAHFYLKHQEPDAAAKYAVMAQEPQILMTILEKYGLSVFGEGKRKLVSEYLKYIEESNMELPPEVCLIAAVCAFWDCNYMKTDEVISIACNRDPAYDGYKKLFRGLALIRSLSGGQGSSQGEEDGQGTRGQPDEGFSLAAEGYKLLKQKKRHLPPLPEDMGGILSQIEKKQPQNREQQKFLRVSCFGKFRVVISGTGKEISWRTRKALELFAYLVDLEGKPVERRVLLEQLWPDNPPNNTVAMLHNMIYSIRKELSSQPELADLIQYKGHQYYLDVSRLSVDLDSKKRICRLAEMGRAKELYEHREELLQNWGVYLEEVDGTWCMARRTYFERSYGKACRILAGYCREQGDYETEASCWTAYMTADRYSEEAVVGLLRCYANMGERQQMKRIYESARKIFEEEMGLGLSPETTEVYQQAMGRQEGL